MYKFLVLVIAIFITSQLCSQEILQWLTDLNGIDSISDVNKKRHKLKEISEVLLEELGTTEMSDLSSKTKNLLYASSKNGEVSCIAFGALTYTGLFELKWIVKEKETSGQSVWQFHEEITSKNLKSISDLSLDLLYNESKHLYQLRIKSSNGQFEDIVINDLITKCYFETLHKQERDADKDSINTILSKRLNLLWSDAVNYENDLAYLKRMKTIFSKNNKVKICTYNVEKNDFKHDFYGAVISKMDGQVFVYPLKDQTEKIKSPERASLSDKKWFGAIYLDVVEVKDKNKTIYTLLGYKGHDEFIKTRVLDALVIQNNRLRFGVPIFKVDRLTRHRMIYKYSAGANMMLKYDSKMKMIVLDNLEPAESFYRGVHRFYGPDFSYNGFKFQGGYWEFEKDIDLRNPKGARP